MKETSACHRGGDMTSITGPRSHDLSQTNCRGCTWTEPCTWTVTRRASLYTRPCQPPALQRCSFPLKETSQSLVQIRSWRNGHSASPRGQSASFIRINQWRVSSGEKSFGGFFWQGGRGCFRGPEWVCDITRHVLLLMQVIRTEMRVKLG